MPVELPTIIGLPPDTYLSDDIRNSSMPVMYITPCEPNFTQGISLFNLKNAFKEYKGILEKHDYTTKSETINLAFIADNFPTDSFTNEYGESFLNKISDVASQGFGEVSQMLGAENLGEASKNIESFLKEQGGMLQSVGGAMGGAREKLGALQKALQQKGNTGKFLAGAGTLIGRMMAGARVDFPQVWKNSGFAPSYTATIRLYNPNPASDISTLKYIIGPIAAILCLALPRAGAKTEEANTYNWPFLHKIRCPGIFNLTSAFISNVSVIKGGDQQQISWNQHLAMVDVRIDIGSLYNSILTEVGAKVKAERPTLSNYLSSLLDKKAYVWKSTPDTRKTPPIPSTSILQEINVPTKKTLPKATNDEFTEAPTRVSSSDVTKASALGG